MKWLMVSLLCVGCSYNNPAWHIVGRSMDGWQKVVDEVLVESPCRLPSGFYGGEIEVRDLPGMYPCNWAPVYGCTKPGGVIVAWAPLAEDSALPEELCHTVIGKCTRDYTEPPAKACKGRVVKRVKAWRAGS